MIRQLFVSSRPLSWVNTAFPFAAAYFLATREVDARLIIGTLFFLIPYNLAMYGINDVFDYESDLRNPRKGGVEGALLDPRIHRTTLIASVVTTLPFVIVLVAFGSWPSWIVLAISLFAVVAYSAKSLRFKERPFLDSVTSSTHFVSPAIYALALAGVAPTWPIVAFILAFFAWGIASHAFGAVQDIEADREGGIASIATVIGGAATVRFAIGAYLVGGLLMLGTTWPGPLGGLLVLPYVAMCWPYRSVTDATAATANRGWRRFLALNYVVGFLATMLLIWWALAHPV